jgi:oxalate decarboxylase/phosphoglucose isomerase-like protein (cupin superfamily)
MIDLSNISGLPLRFNEETVSLELDTCLECSHQEQVPLSSIIPTLLNKFLKYPETVYSHHKRIAHIDDLEGVNGISYDILVMPYGLLGIEYIRTHVYYSDYVAGKYDTIVEVLSGNLSVVMQKNENEEDVDPYSFETEVDRIHVVDLRKGDRLAIPTGYFYTFVNTSQNPVIFSKVTGAEKQPVDYSVLEKERGLAYYIISKNARTEVVPNPKYKINNELEHVMLNDLLSDDMFFLAELYDNPQPLYNHYAKNHKKLQEWLSY